MAAACVRRSRPTCRAPNRRPSAASLDALTPDGALVARFSTDLDALAGPGPLGLAVSGGSDSMALLLLAAAARPGAVEVLSVNHGLRPEAQEEVAAVGRLSRTLGLPFHPLALDMASGGNLQAAARAARYAAMADVATRRGLAALATAHHADDQAETLVMRLARGAGLSGLAAIRPSQSIAGLKVVRPLLGWRKRELETVGRSAGVEWAEDPSNADPAFDRVRIRTALAGLDLDPRALAQSAGHLADADSALEWAIDGLAGRLRVDGPAATLDVEDLPIEIARRLLLRAFVALDSDKPRGPDLERAMAALREGRKSSLSGLLLSPLSATSWRLAPEPPRRG